MPQFIPYADNSANLANTYYYRIIAKNSGGSSPPSNVVSYVPGAVVDIRELSNPNQIVDEFNTLNKTYSYSGGVSTTTGLQNDPSALHFTSNSTVIYNANNAIKDCFIFMGWKNGANNCISISLSTDNITYVAASPSLVNYGAYGSFNMGRLEQSQIDGNYKYIKITVNYQAGLENNLYVGRLEMDTDNSFSPIIKNPSFETGDYSSWTLASGNSFSVTPSDKHTGTYSLDLTAHANGSNIYQDIAVDQNTNYRWTIYGKCSNIQGLKVMTTGQTLIQQVNTLYNGSWTQYSVDFNSGNNGVVMLDIADCTGNLTNNYFDDNVVTKITVANPGYEMGTLGNWNINSGTWALSSADKHTGTYSLMLTAQHLYGYIYQNIAVSPNTNYSWTIFAKCPDIQQFKVTPTDYSSTIAYQNTKNNNQWTMYTINFNSGNYSVLKLAIVDCTGTNYNYFDDSTVTQTNLVANSGFETGDLSSWTVPGTGDWAISSSDKFSGTYSIKLNGRSDSCMLTQNILVTPYTDYTWTFYGKCNSSTIPYMILDAQNVIIQDGGYCSDNSCWTKYALSFNSGNNKTVNICISDGGGVDYFDDFCVQQNILQNSNFESGALDNWNISSGNNWSISTDDKNSGLYSVKLEAHADYSYIWQDIAVIPNTDYSWTAYAKCPNIQQFKVETTDLNTTIAYQNSTCDNQWELNTINFNSGNNSVVRVFIVDCAGSGVNYFDDNVIQALQVQNAGFEAGTTYAPWTVSSGNDWTVSSADKNSGTYSLQLTANADGSYTYQNVAVNPNTNYRWTIYGRTPNVQCLKVMTTNLTLIQQIATNYSNQWTMYTIDFNSGCNGVVMLAIADLSGSSTLNYFDDSSLNTIVVANPGFETGTLANWTVSSGNDWTVSSADKNSGTYSLQLTANADGSYTYQNVAVNPNTNYRWTIYGRTPNVQCLKVMTTNLTLIQQIATNYSNQWTMYTIDFNSGCNGVVMLAIADLSGSSTLNYFDDSSLNTIVVANPGFETGTLANWTVSSGNDWTVSSADKNSGTYSLKLTATHDYRYIYQDIAVTPNTNYRWTIYAKCPDAQAFKVVTTDNSTTIVQTSSSNNNQWTMNTIDFNSGGNSAVGLMIADCAGTNVNYFDDSSVSSINSVAKSDFEMGTLDNWTVSGGFDWTISPDDKHSGSYSLKLSATGDACYVSKDISVTPNTSYSWNIYAKCSNVQQFKVTTTGFSTIQLANTLSNNLWTLYTINFNSGSNGIVKLIIADCTNGGVDYFDDSVVDNTILLNSGFETGTLANWTTSKSPPNDWSVTATDKNSGTYSLMLTATHDLCYIYQDIAVVPNTNYCWNIYAKCPNIQQFKVMSTDLSNTITYVNSTNNNQWTLNTITFNSGNYSVLRLAIADCSGTGYNYFDDSVVAKVSPTDYSNFEIGTQGDWNVVQNGGVNDWTISPDDKHSGTYSLKLAATGDWCYIYKDISVAPNTNYTWTIYAKCSSAQQLKVTTMNFTNILVVSTLGNNQWTQYTLSFNSGSNSMVKLLISDCTSGTNYFDDSVLVES